MTNTLTLTLALSYVAPKPPPASGAGWPEERDYPGVEATVGLPMADDDFGYLRHDLRDGALTCCGVPLYETWGIERAKGDTHRTVRSIFRAATLEAAEAEARAWHAEGAAVIAGILAARETRLAQREATIALAHARPGNVEIPPPDVAD